MSERSSSQEPADFADLRRRLEAAVRHVAPPWLAPQCDDLVQAAMLKVYKSAGQPLQSAFLYRVAHSVIVDEIRRVKRRKEDLMTPSFPDRQASRTSTLPDDEAESKQISSAILGCLETLSADRRRAVTLHLQGHSVPEAATILGYTPKKAENLVYRGMADLRECLKKKGVQP